MERIITLQNKHWVGTPYPNLIERKQLSSLLTKLELKEIQVLLGIRRSGKSTLFRLIINKLIQTVNPKQILYINFDDPFYSDILNDSRQLYSIIDKAESITGAKPLYIFLDEVQQVKAWEKFVKSAYDNELFTKIYITGSNSGLLKTEYASLLSGRYNIEHVYPLSFNEMLIAQNLVKPLEQQTNKPSVLALFEDYLFFGGFPEVYKTENADLKREILLNYYDTILIKDCIVNKNIREAKTFRNLAYYLLTTCTLPYTYNSLGKNINSNENTVKDFVNVMVDSFLLSEVYHFSYSLKNQIKLKKKIYCTDNGIVNAVSFSFSENKGRLFENLVFNELTKLNIGEIFYFNDNKECDFIIKYNNKFIAIQVCYQLTASNKDREVTGLKNAMEKLNINKGILLTTTELYQPIENIVICSLQNMEQELNK